MTRVIAFCLLSPSSGPELIMRPAPVSATPVAAGSSPGTSSDSSISGVMTGIAPVTGAFVSTTTFTGRSNVRAKSRSRWSCAGTAITAPWP